MCQLAVTPLLAEPSPWHLQEMQQHLLLLLLVMPVLS
jgi:hypothetical protein